MSIHFLYPCLLGQIANYLNVTELTRFMKTCKDFYQDIPKNIQGLSFDTTQKCDSLGVILVRFNLLNSRLQFLNIYETPFKNLNLQNVVEKCSNLKVLNIYDNEDIDLCQSINQKLASLPIRGSQLTKLSLFFCSGNLKDLGMQHIARSCPALISLSIPWSDITNLSLQYISNGCKRLMELNINECHVTDKGLQYLSEGCHFLMILHINNSWSITEKGLEYLSNGCRELTELYMEGCKVNDLGLQHLANNCSKLEKLDIPERTDYDSSNITDLGLEYLSNGCPKLTYLNVQFCSRITDVGLEYLSNGCPELTYLNASKCSITDQGLEYIAKKCHRLMHLNVDGCHDITEEGLEEIAQNCPQLTELSISNCVDMDIDEGLEILSEANLNLKDLDISYNDISNSSLKSLEFHELTSLNVIFCPYITNLGMRYIAKRCQHLKYLGAIGCEISDEGIIEIAKQCHELTILDIAGCPITKLSLEALSQGCPKLQILNVNHCENITDQELEQYFPSKHFSTA